MPDIKEEEYTIKEARSLPDYLFLRKLRNEVRHSMTNDTSIIGVLQQLRFFLTKPQHMHVYIALRRGQRAGYLLLKETPETVWITEAVAQAFRKQGLAKRIVAYAQRLYPHLTAEIRNNNAASIRLHEACGFRLASQNEAKCLYVWQR